MASRDHWSFGYIRLGEPPPSQDRRKRQSPDWPIPGSKRRRLHYVERGSAAAGPADGNGSMIQDFKSSGLIDFRRGFRVIVFDRPGFGHSYRPRNIVWTPAAQAELLAARSIGWASHTRCIGALLGRFCRSRAGAQISETWSKAWFLPRDITIQLCELTWLLFGPRGAFGGQCFGPHTVTDCKPGDVAASYGQNLWSPVRSKEI